MWIKSLWFKSAICFGCLEVMPQHLGLRSGLSVTHSKKWILCPKSTFVCRQMYLHFTVKWLSRHFPWIVVENRAWGNWETSGILCLVLPRISVQCLHMLDSSRMMLISSYKLFTSLAATLGFFYASLSILHCPLWVILAGCPLLWSIAIISIYRQYV